MDTQRDNRECLVVMPIEYFCDGYEEGHFRRVYEFIIKPSVIKAGLKPVSSYDLVKGDYVDHTYIIRRIMEAPVVIFDLSSRNRGVITALKIRQAFDCNPHLIIKDDQTPGDGCIVRKAKTIEYSKKCDFRHVTYAKLAISLSLLRLDKATAELLPN